MDIRSTKDIDFVVSVASYLDYQSFIERLKSRNFVEYIPTEEEPPICRYKYHGIMVDVMPDDEAVLGFSNPWFKWGLANALLHTLPNGAQIQLIPPSYLLATKLSAYFGRATHMLESKDAEDIVILINGRDSLVAEVLSSPVVLLQYIQQALSTFINDSNFDYLLSGSLVGEESERLGIVAERFHRLASLSE